MQKSSLRPRAPGFLCTGRASACILRRGRCRIIIILARAVLRPRRYSSHQCADLRHALDVRGGPSVIGARIAGGTIVKLQSIPRGLVHLRQVVDHSYKFVRGIVEGPSQISDDSASTQLLWFALIPSGQRDRRSQPDVGFGSSYPSRLPSFPRALLSASLHRRTFDSSVPRYASRSK